MVTATDMRVIEVLPRGIDVPRPRSVAPKDWSSYFEDIYRAAEGDAAAVPWADGHPNSALVAWLNAEAPGILRPGATVAVVGCGLGDDVQELSDRGYDVVGFDCSPTAIAWARRRHCAVADRLLVADLFELPPSLLRRHDLVVEVHTLQAIDPGLRERAAGAIVSLARPRGAVLTICRAREEGEALGEEPPFPLTPSELEGVMDSKGFAPARALDIFSDDEDPPKLRLRGLFRRA
jgi:hypothetical protein